MTIENDRTLLELANYLDAYCGYDPKSLFHKRVHEAAALIRQQQAEIERLELLACSIEYDGDPRGL